MQVRVLLPLASMGVEHGARAPSEGLAPDGAIKIIQALCPTAHERAQHTRRVLVKGRAEHRRDRQDDMPLDAPRLEGLAHLAHPITYHPQSGWFEDTPLKGGTEEGCPLKGVHEGTFLIEAGHPAWNHSRASGLTVVLRLGLLYGLGS